MFLPRNYICSHGEGLGRRATLAPHLEFLALAKMALIPPTLLSQGLSAHRLQDTVPGQGAKRYRLSLSAFSWVGGSFKCH